MVCCHILATLIFYASITIFMYVFLIYYFVYKVPYNIFGIKKLRCWYNYDEVYISKGRAAMKTVENLLCSKHLLNIYQIYILISYIINIIKTYIYLHTGVQVFSLPKAL